MATSTMYSFLMKSTDGSTYTKLCDIKDYPDLGGEPELLETTTLSNHAHTYTPGLQVNEIKPFTCNYDKTVYQTIKSLHGTETYFSVWFGASVSGTTVTPDGTNGKFNFKGDADVYVSGKGVNEVREMIVTIVPSSDGVELV